MFSGIIDAIGHVRECTASPVGRRLCVQCNGYWAGVAPGASIAVDGVCLTIAHQNDDQAEFDVIHESLRRTTLGSLKPGDRVNLQKSLVVGDAIDGHFVQGHVDAVGVIDLIVTDSGEALWSFSIDHDAHSYMIPKGSVA